MTFTDRYVATTLRRIPADTRDDIDRELRGSIADAIDARIAAGTDPVEAETEVLTDLGDPDRLAAGYAGRPLYLIGPDLYLDWWRLLKGLLWIAPVLGLVLMALDIFDGEPAGSAIWEGISTTAVVSLQTAFWTTLVFAGLERHGRRRKNLAGEWSVDRLPEIDRAGPVSLLDTVFSVALLVFLVVAPLLQRGFSAYQDVDGDPIPVLDPDLWSFWLPVLLTVLVLDIVLEIVKFAVGRWTVPLAAANTLLSVLFTVPLVWLASNDMLLEPAYFDAAFRDDGAGALQLFNQAVIVVAVVAAVWEIGEGWAKARRTGG